MFSSYDLTQAFVRKIEIEAAIFSLYLWIFINMYKNMEMRSDCLVFYLYPMLLGWHGLLDLILFTDKIVYTKIRN